MPNRKVENSGPELNNQIPAPLTVPATTGPASVKQEMVDDDFDPALEAEISEFYRIVLPGEDGAVAGSEEEWKDDGEGLDILPHVRQADDPIEVDPVVDLSPRMAQLEILSQSNQPYVFVTVHRMYESFEFQLWEVVPIATLKDLLEDLTEVSPQDMRIYLKNGTVMEDTKTFKDYGIEANIYHLENPARLFVGFRADLEYISDDEVEEEEEETDGDVELSPGLEYFEMVSDIDFTAEIERDREFDDWATKDVDFSDEYTIIRPNHGVGEKGISAFPGARKGDGIKTTSDSIEMSNRPQWLRKDEPEANDNDVEDFVPFTLKKG